MKKKDLYKYIRGRVYKQCTKHPKGFNDIELGKIKDRIIRIFPGFNNLKFEEAMFGNTCMIVDNKMVYYHCDVENALLCGIEGRDLYFYE